MRKREFFAAVMAATMLITGSIGYSFADTVGENVKTADASADTPMLISAPVETKTVSFSDVKDGKWYYENVTKIAAAGAINGYPDGTFKPDNQMTRAEFVKVCVALLDDKVDSAENQKAIEDLTKVGSIPADKWYTKYAARSMTLEILPGGMPTMNNEDWNKAMSREEMATVVEKCAEKLCDESVYTDEKTLANAQSHISDYYTINYQKDVLQAYARGLVGGMTASTFEPKGTATRAQAATMIYRLTDKAARLNNIELNTYEEAFKAAGVYDLPKSGDALTINKAVNLCDYEGNLLPYIYENCVKYTTMTPEEFNRKYPVTKALYTSNMLTIYYEKAHFSAVDTIIASSTTGKVGLWALSGTSTGNSWDLNGRTTYENSYGFLFVPYKSDTAILVPGYYEFVKSLPTYKPYF